ncbi:MAG TPA: amidohydrolase/deacetylase family metallohydrolase [Geminicoccus sp.]|jgi:dihydroorotase|uniref:amidohydrolase/deacetylase family metallohydrolase n=1 Tax=Geminicoccus sp. TaxID=2024832 RepID=UPI002E3508C0|nr:amidohydrolase/deacetylase family metallohydrolase [Geminicoccus sp.]HEX2525033.1 amidohydrolase/deacetylase family metallohydrolase [Geminicoccus sp.]
MSYELVLTGGRVVDPGQEIDRTTDVAFEGGKVAAVGDGLAGDARQVRDVAGAIVLPGMIDFHTHVYWGGTSLGIRPDALARRAGTTTWLDVGSAGPGNFEGFREHVIGRTETRILVYLHVSFAGIYGFSDRVSVGESDDMRLLEPNVCAEVARANPELVRGIKVRIGRHASGYNGITPLKFAIEAAEQAELPVMCHIDAPPPRYEEVLEVLRPGDTLTHCFRPSPNAPIYNDGRIREACFTAREKGILFDIGHGMGSFSFPVAEAMLAGGFPPDIISSDVHALCIDGPAFDNLETMSKFLNLGMSIPDIVRAVTKTPADALKRPDLADLSVGSTGDATVLRVDEGRFRFVDVQNRAMVGDRKFRLDSVVLGGRLWHDARPAG